MYHFGDYLKESILYKGCRCKYCRSNQHGHGLCSNFSHNAFQLLLESALKSQVAPPRAKIVVPSFIETFIPVKHDNSVICLPNWDSYLTDIALLLVESHISNLGDTFEGLSLLFDDSCDTPIVTSWLSLELVNDQFPVVPCLSPYIVIGCALDWFVASFSKVLVTRANFKDIIILHLDFASYHFLFRMGSILAFLFGLSSFQGEKCCL